MGVETTPERDALGRRLGKGGRSEVGRRVRRRQPAGAAGRPVRRRRPCSSATASPRRSSSGTTSKAWTSRTRSSCCSPNEPPSNDPKFFDGRALTYYGRWTYKYEEALRHGARAAIIIHTTPTASYGWDVVRNSWGRETPFVKLGAWREGAFACRAGSAKRPATNCSALANHTVDELLAASEKPDFKPINLGIQIRCHIPSKVREIADAQRGGDHSGQRPEAEGRGRDLQRALGPPRHRHAGERGQHLQRRDRQRHRMRHPAGTGACLGIAAAEAEALGAVPRGDGGGGRAARLGILRGASVDSAGQDGHRA